METELKKILKRFGKWLLQEENKLKKNLEHIEKWLFRGVIFIILAFALAVYLYNYQHSKVLFFAKPSSSKVNHQAALIAEIIKKPNIRVLTIDGGGLRGIIALQVLIYLEQKTGRPISQLFDVVGGTSTGAIIVSALTRPGEDGQPHYSAQKISDSYQALSKQLLASSFWHQALTVNGLFGPMYNIKRVDRTLQDYLGHDARLNHSLALTILYTYSITNMELRAMKSWKLDDYYHAFFQHSLVLSAIAAPGFFLPVVLTLDEHSALEVNIDSAVMLENPSLQTMREVSNDFPGKKYIILSLGDGLSKVNIVSRDNRFGAHGLLYWSRNVSTVSMRGQAGKEHSYLSHLAQQKNSPVIYYLRITPDIYIPSQCTFLSVDDFCINAFKEIGQEAVKQNKKQLDALAAVLLANQ